MQQEAYDFIQNNQQFHWWFKGRHEIVQAYLKYLNLNGKKEILDVGSGFGAMIPLLMTKGQVESLEPFEGCHETLEGLGVKTIHKIKDFPHKTPDKEYDLITLFDVLEHINDDYLTLEVIKKELLKTNGILILTVPAFQWLWTKHDEVHEHKRRYSKRRLLGILKEIGYSDIRIGFFMNRLFIPAVLQRFVQKITGHVSVDESTAPWLNRLFYSIFREERRRFAKGHSFSYGLSIIVSAKNDSHD